MSEQRTNWFQRLVGADGVTSPATEEELARTKEEARRLSEQLKEEREQLAARDRKIEELEAKADSAERHFETELAALEQSTKDRLDSRKDLEREYDKLAAELETVRAAQQKLTDERTKLSLALTRQRDESSKLAKALGAAKEDAQKARAQAIELERVAEVGAMDLADCKQKLQAVEIRTSTLEHELAATKQAQQSAEAAAATLGKVASDYARIKDEATRQKSELESALANLGEERSQREVAFTMASDLWGALDRAVGDAALLALVLGVDDGHVERASNLGDATSALKRALEDAAQCQGIEVEAQEHGMQVELRNWQLLGNDAAAPWLMASATRFLEKAVGAEFAIETSTLDQDTLTFRLQKSGNEQQAS